MQYSYILQHPLSLHVSQANFLVLSEPVLQHPEDNKSDLEQTYPLSSTIRTLPCTEFRQVTILELVKFTSFSECQRNELVNFFFIEIELLSCEDNSVIFYKIRKKNFFYYVYTSSRYLC